MGTRLTSLLAAFALAAVFNAAITRDQAWAVVCANDPGAPKIPRPVIACHASFIGQCHRADT